MSTIRMSGDNHAANQKHDTMERRDWRLEKKNKGTTNVLSQVRGYLKYARDLQDKKELPI